MTCQYPIINCKEIIRATLDFLFRTIDNDRMTWDFTKILHSPLNVNKLQSVIASMGDAQGWQLTILPFTKMFYAIKLSLIKRSWGESEVSLNSQAQLDVGPCNDAGVVKESSPSKYTS